MPRQMWGISMSEYNVCSQTVIFVIHTVAAQRTAAQRTAAQKTAAQRDVAFEETLNKASHLTAFCA